LVTGAMEFAHDRLAYAVLKADDSYHKWQEFFCF
jgi:hypothetical protein